MVNIFTNKSSISTIDDVELWVQSMGKLGEIFQGPQYDFIMREIDGVKARRLDSIETPIGYTTIYNLSTGCKSVMLAYYLRNKSDICISIMECGVNALDTLFRIGEFCDLRVYTRNPIDLNRIEFKGTKCKIDGHTIIGAKQILDYTTRVWEGIV